MHENEAAERAVRLMTKVRDEAINQGISMNGTEVVILTLVAKLDMFGKELADTLENVRGSGD